MYDFEFVRAGSVDEAVRALQSEDAQPLGGGQSLLPAMKARLAAPSRLVSLSTIPEIIGVRQEGDALVIGGATTHGRIATEAAGAFPALSRQAQKVGDPAVRSRGTIGGSLANNDPSACYPTAVLATAGTIITDRREIPGAAFFQGMFATALEEQEIITGVRLPIPDAAHYEKFDQPASRFALVGVFVARRGPEVRVAVTGASIDGVFRWTEAEQALTRSFSADAVSSLRVAEEDMISDLAGSAAYRAQLVKVVTGRAVTRAAAGSR